ncbi:Chaperone protein dnaJ 49 [Morus notabilis]|uniref:Chaperone protein dnaJ 49 n=1 Tax=Morus notabilis TaxID=981085 RepID=W9SDA9_9ROSA|nr:dnaJ homolog subfamily C member 17 [Morus notabilis]EXC23286.1 Chaperone protein dnaJ 49 [Morus notabilis]
MGKMGQESDIKSQLVAQICSISSRSNACVHRHLFNRPKSSPTFIDWYLLLGVGEEAGIDVIRKRYHKLALQLHPDKNKHPKAEIAFKLVSEAYACLSDSAQRKAFDLERWRNFCFECIANPTNSNTPKHKAWSAAPTRSKSHRILRGLKDIRDRFREETRVIENCLRANAAASRKERESSLFPPPDCIFRSNSQRAASHKESPIFNPSDYKFEGYPHVRNRVYKKPDNLWFLQTGNILNCEARGKCDTPIFEVRSDRGIFKSKSACVHS